MKPRHPHRIEARPALRFCALGLVALAGACGAGVEERPPNVLLISIDSLRADHLGCYGYERDTSPAIDRLAREGVRFAGATSSSSWTLPAHASLFTGLPTSAHGTTAARPLIESRRTLAEALVQGGYATVGFWAGPYLHPRFGLDQGFEEWINCASFSFEDDDVRRANEESHVDVTNPGVLERFEGWLERSPRQPFLAFVHLWDVHYDYIPPAPFDTRFTDPDYRGTVDGGVPRGTLTRPDLEQLVALYDGEIAWTDLHVGRLMALLEAHGLEQDTVVILTADHGEEFYEHGRFGHRKALYEESIAVPLIVRHPGRLAAGRVIHAAASLLDLAPTVLEMAGLPPLPDVLGRSLVPELRGLEQGRERIAVSELLRGDERLLAIRGADWKVLLDAQSAQLRARWDLGADPGEEHDLGPPDAALERLVGDMRSQLVRLSLLHASEAGPEDSALPEGLENALRDLGYVGEEE